MPAIKQSKKENRRPKLILELSKAGENQHLSGDKGVCEQQAVRVTTYGGLKWRLGLADGACEVRGGLWGWCGVCRMRQSAPALPK